MSNELKRVPLVVVPSGEILKKSDKDASVKSSKSKSLRLELKLFEPTEETFPEFNYNRLMHIEKVIR